MSDVDLVERALYDLSYKYFLGLNPEDEDAKTGYKSADTAFFGYKTHIAMTPERIITAATITSGEKPDGKELPKLVEKSRKAGMTVENVIADRAYSGKVNLTLANQKDENDKKNFKLISRLNPSITEGFRQLSKERYKIEAKNSELKKIWAFPCALSLCSFAPGRYVTGSAFAPASALTHFIRSFAVAAFGALHSANAFFNSVKSSKISKIK